MLWEKNTKRKLFSQKESIFWAFRTRPAALFLNSHNKPITYEDFND